MARLEKYRNVEIRDGNPPLPLIYPETIKNLRIHKNQSIFSCIYVTVKSEFLNKALWSEMAGLSKNVWNQISRLIIPHNARNGTLSRLEVLGICRGNISRFLAEFKVSSIKLLTSGFDRAQISKGTGKPILSFL